MTSNALEAFHAIMEAATDLLDPEESYEEYFGDNAAIVEAALREAE